MRYSSILVFCLAIVSCSALLQTSQQGQSCKNNNQCFGIYSRCTATSLNEVGTCQLGYEKGHSCMFDSDCLLNSTATVCTNKICSADSYGYSASQTNCQSHFQCNSIANSRCLGSVCVIGALCAESCRDNNDCSSSTPCKWCFGASPSQNGTCRAQCGAP